MANNRRELSVNIIFISLLFMLGECSSLSLNYVHLSTGGLGVKKGIRNSINSSAAAAVGNESNRSGCFNVKYSVKFRQIFFFLGDDRDSLTTPTWMGVVY